MKAQYTSKTAKARWQKEYEKELAQRAGLPPKELKRVITHEQIGGGIADIKKQYQAFASPLKTPEQVQRRAKLDRKLTDWYMRHGDALRVNPGPLGAINLAGTVMMDPDKFPQFLKNIAERSGRPLPNIPESAWPAITKAVLEHERAEGVQLGNVVSGQHASAAHASHAGLLPLLAERMNVQDPHAVKVMDWLRQLNSEDKKTARALKQHGQVGNYVLPFGGRAHRSAEKQIIKKINPQLDAPQFQRMLSSSAGTPQDFIAHTSAIPSGTPAQMRSVRTGGLLRPGKLKALAGLGLLLAPLAYPYYRYRKGLSDQVEGNKTASVKDLLKRPNNAIQLGSTAAMSLWAHDSLNEAVRDQIMEEDPYAKYKLYGVPLGAGLATYGLLSHKYPKASPAAKLLGALTVGGTAAPLVSYGLIAETLGRTDIDAARRYAQAKREGAKFHNYYSNPSFTKGRYNDLFETAAHGTSKPWHSYFLDKELQDNIAEYKL
jgi:hypothetical protein